MKHWDLDSPASLKSYIARVNAIRRENKALQGMEGIALSSDRQSLLDLLQQGDEGSFGQDFGGGESGSV